MDSSNNFKSHLESLVKKYPDFKTFKDYELFTLLCSKYFFFSEVGSQFDPEKAIEYLTDGPNDGGIDAIFNDFTSESNDIIILQSKYYNNTSLTNEMIVGELYKISETIKELRDNQVSKYSERLVTAYKTAMNQMEDDGKIRVYFVTSFLPSSKRDRNKICKSIASHFNEFDDVVIQFKDDIETQIEMCDCGKLCVEYDKLIIDRPNNYLSYEDSVIVNISARSLQDLQNRRRNGLLGLNLRYYVKNKKVDHAIEETVISDAQNFWYKNNGILIVCEDYTIEDIEVSLTNFSIVNGGQTTTMIGGLDIPPQDFYLQCKIVKAKGSLQKDKDQFTHNIAEATNSQKPIKEADLKANAPEQLRLKERLSNHNMYYITKKGDKVPKKYADSYYPITLDQIGKLSLAGVLQMPGSARSSSKKMYNEENYLSIFGEEAKDGVIADLYKINSYYESFLKTEVKDRGYDEETVLPALKNGRTFQLACITFLAKVNKGTFTYEAVTRVLNKPDELKELLRGMKDLDCIIVNKLEDERETFYRVFGIIGDEILGYCYSNALEKAKEEQKTLAASDYLKLDTNYYKDIIKRLWSRYNGYKELKGLIDKIVVKDK